ncbi:MAG: S49 family peptidase, partial [Bacteroidota bacterium]
GGSSTASDTLWKELMLLKAKKPVVASMSDIAASGGYYMAAACDYIWAHPTTITGSIGIWGVFFDVNVLLRQKLGITTDVAKTSPSADLFTNLGRPLSRKEKQFIQRSLDKGYATFLEKVAQGRSLGKQTVEKIASGRIWTGSMAKERGLVDALGGLEDAIQTAANLIQLEEGEYTVTQFPATQSFWQELLKNEDREAPGAMAWQALQAKIPQLQHFQTLVDLQGMQARLPYEIVIE